MSQVLSSHKPISLFYHDHRVFRCRDPNLHIQNKQINKLVIINFQSHPHAGAAMPQNVTVKEPDAGIVSFYAEDDVSLTRDVDSIFLQWIDEVVPTARRAARTSREGVVGVVATAGWGVRGKDQKVVSMEVERVPFLVQIVDYDVYPPSLAAVLDRNLGD